MSTENPAFAGTEQNADSVDIEAALRDGTLSSDEAVVLMEERLKAGEERMKLRMRDEMAQLEARLRAELSGASGDTGFATTVRGVVARLTETPTNFHQATVHFIATDAPQDAAMARWSPLLYAGSLAMVLLQSMTAVGVLIGTVLPSCATSDQCDAGTY